MSTLKKPSSLSTDPRARLLATLPVSERRLTLARVSTAVVEAGDGAPVVLLHGPGAHGVAWLRVIPDLAEHARVIAPDLPSHGASDPFDGSPDTGRLLAWLDDLIERTCETPPVLVGHLLGGALAARFAAQRGDRLRGLVLVDTLGLQDFDPAPDFGRALAAFAAHPTDATHDALWALCAFDLEAMRQRMGEQWDAIRAYTLDRARVPALRAGQHALMAAVGLHAIPHDQIARIAVPTTLIWGRHDRATPLRVAEAASLRYGWPLHVIEQAADDPPMEQPAAFLVALRTALALSDVSSASTWHHRSAWNRIAPAYDRTNTPTQMRIAAEGLRRVGLRAGMSFLDVAAGSGALSIPAARLGARVLAIDQSPVMLDLLAARARAEGLAIETRVMDGHALALPDGAFDVAGSQFGVMLFPDMPRGISEMARVVKPGGSVLVHAYGDPGQIEFLQFLIDAIRSVRPGFDGPPTDPPPYEFQLADPRRLRDELAAAGLRQVTVDTVTETTEFESGDALWEWIASSNPIVETILEALDLSAAELCSVKDALASLVRRRSAGQRIARLANPVHIGLGTK